MILVLLLWRVFYIRLFFFALGAYSVLWIAEYLWRAAWA